MTNLEIIALDLRIATLGYHLSDIPAMMAIIRDLNDRIEALEPPTLEDLGRESCRWDAES